MAEPTHGDILRRIDGVEERLAGVEHRQEDAERREGVMSTQIARIGEQSDRAARVAEENRVAFQKDMKEVKGLIGAHRDEFQSFRGHVEGAAMIVKWGLPLGLTAILAMLGMLLA